MPEEFLATEYITQQFVERLIHYILSVPLKSFSNPQLSQILEQMDPRHQVLFFKS